MSETAPGSRLDAVEIKVTIGPSAMAKAMKALDLDPGSGARRRIWFCEVAGHGVQATQAGHGVQATQAGHGVQATQAGHGVQATQAGHGVQAREAGHEPVLLGQGVILRLRETEGKGADSTVKFRPFDPSKLLARWRDLHEVDGGELRVEGDWVGTRRVVSASFVADQGDDEPAEAAAGRRPLSKLFSKDQEDFLRDQAVIPVHLSGVRALGPVSALKWEPRDRGLPRDLAAEHWKVDDLEFLELSVRADDPVDAADLQRQLDRALGKRGLATDVVQETKTRTVLDHLIRRR